MSVSRETLEALHSFEALVLRWSSAINLVSKASLPDVWSRHILDSAQVFALCPPRATSWVDLGSGGGFPGLVVAVLARELKPDLQISLVESDLRKATFLRQAAQELKLPVKVVSQRIESVPPLNADVLSARALASLPDLLQFAELHLARGGTALFPKGARYAKELADARKLWTFETEIQSSVSDKEAAILLIRKINRVQEN